MTKQELIKKYEEMMEQYRKSSSLYEFYANPSIARVEPFKIADQLYYVGDKKVCIHLIDTGDGLILLDSGYLGATHLLVDSIWRAGFDPKNVHWIIHTHGHYDHFGASEEFRIMYGTKLAISKVDAEYLRTNPKRALINKERYPLAQVPAFDYEIEDGEIFELGNIKIRCMLSPGHTPGVLSLFFDVTDNGKTYLAGMFGGAGINATTLPYLVNDERSFDAAEQMLNSIEKLKKEPVIVHIGNHPQNNGTFSKREKQLKEGGNPFVAPESWINMLNGLEIAVKDISKENKELISSLTD